MFKYMYNGKEIDKKHFESIATELYKWFDKDIVNAIDYPTVFDGNYKSVRTISNHVKSVLENNFSRCSPQCFCDGSCNKLQKQENTGEKHNKGKLPMSKLFIQFPDALQAVILASCYGNFKYPKDTDWLNFKRVPGGSQNYRDAEIRHFLGGENDEESGLPEIFHQAWNKLAELQLWLEENNINIKKFSKEYLDNLK